MTVREGSIVWLKTGGPAMTAKFETMNGGWLCSWFDNANIVREHEFMADQLTDKDPNPSGMMPMSGGH